MYSYLIKYRILALLLLVLLPEYLWSQSGSVSYVRQRNVHKEGVTSTSTLSTLPPLDMTQTTTYLDGIGRTSQTVVKQGSALLHDVIQPIEYDNLGRVTRSHLSYVDVAASDGSYKPNAFSSQASFWQNTNLTKTPSESHPYSITLPEASPLQRVKEQGSVGKIWNPTQKPDGTANGGDGKTTQTLYSLNTSTDNVRKWVYNSDTGAIIPSGNYSANTLSKLEVQGPDRATAGSVDRIQIFTDGRGQTILQRSFLGATLYDTYYVYDDFGQLQAIIPPRAVQEMGTTWNLLATPAATTPLTILEAYCYTFEYDERGRLIEKSVPGTGPAGTLRMVYDQLDRIIMTQDGRQRSGGKNEWTVIKYDIYGREIMTVLAQVVSTKTHQNLQHDARTATLVYETSSVVNTTEQYPATLTLNQPLDLPRTATATQAVILGSGFSFSGNDGIFEAKTQPQNTQNQQQVVYTTTQSFPNLNSTQWVTSHIVLNYTYYDNYSFIENGQGISNFQTFTNPTTDPNHFSTAEHPQAFSRNGQVEGQVTGGRVRVLSPNQNAGEVWLESALFYDDDFNVAQVQSDNYRGGRDIITTKYHFDGRMDKTLTVHRVDMNGDDTPEETTVAEWYTYTPAGQVDQVYHRVKNSSIASPQAQILAKMTYSELGEVIAKRLGVDAAGNCLQQVDYRSNIQGWLTRINDANLSTTDHPSGAAPNDLFGMELSYGARPAVSSFTAEYSGNITQIDWRSNIDLTRRTYQYNYDDLSRLITADYSDDNNSTNEIFDLSGNYERNGNITSLTRQGLRSRDNGQLNPNYSSIDQLTYYYERGNQLKAVDDGIETGTIRTGLAGDFTDFDGVASRKSSSGATREFSYNPNGFVQSDLNQGLTTIEYNYLDLPRTLIFNNGSATGKISYTYDAAGNVLKKDVEFNYLDDNGLDRFVDRITTDYIGDFVYENGELQFIHTSEGRAFPPGVLLGSGVQYEYFISDHQGNLRVAFRQPTNRIYMANMDNVAADEITNGFKNVALVANGTPAKTTPSAARLNGSGGSNAKPLGPLKILAVGKGDKVNAEVYAYYTTPTTNNKVGDLNAFIQTRLINPNADNDPNTAQDNLDLRNLQFGISFAPSNSNPGGSNLPNAYLKYILYDQEGQFVREGIKYITTANQNSWDTKLRFEFADIPITEDGTLHIFVANESDKDVLFDNFRIEHQPTLIVQENHYDPLGLNLAGIEKQGSPSHPYQYNAQSEKQKHPFLKSYFYESGARM
ncbi:MAG: hypothetical protein HC880_00405 [Bacteroidia bacterium]|nr:hypothetical protein [Bacteroidia bacterium]